jgi:hypothetical protein
MPTQEAIMQQIIGLVGAGAGTTLSDEMQETLRTRYYEWIVRKKDGVPTTPQEIWDDEPGKRIQKQFEKIGKRMGGKHTKADLHEASLQVENESDCPHCP